MQQAIAESITKRGNEVAVTMDFHLPVSAEAVFDFLVAEDVLPKVLTGFSLLPAVIRTSGNTGRWDQPGSSRIVHLADKSTAQEVVTDYERPGYFAYRTSDFTFALKHLATSAAGQWWFEQRQMETHIRWTYTFTARGPMTAIALLIFVRSQWTGYMRVCIENTRQHFGRS
jgi:hypothetical protein